MPMPMPMTMPRTRAKAKAMRRTRRASRVLLVSGIRASDPCTCVPPNDDNKIIIELDDTIIIPGKIKTERREERGRGVGASQTIVDIVC